MNGIFTKSECVACVCTNDSRWMHAAWQCAITCFRVKYARVAMLVLKRYVWLAAWRRRPRARHQIDRSAGARSAGLRGVPWLAESVRVIAITAAESTEDENARLRCAEYQSVKYSRLKARPCASWIQNIGMSSTLDWEWERSLPYNLILMQLSY